MDDFASLLSGFVGEDAGAGDVGGLDGVRVALAVSAEEFDKLVGEVRVRCEGRDAGEVERAR